MTAAAFTSRHFATPAIAAAALFLLAGCGSLDPVVDHTRFYTLAPATAARAATTPDGPAPTRVGIRVNVQPDYLRRSAIAVRTSQNELKLVDEHRWAEDIDEGIARVLAQDLQTRSPHALFAPVSGGGMTSGAPVIIDVTVTACEGIENGAVLEAYWRIDSVSRDGGDRSGHFRNASTGWDGADFSALAGQLSGLVDQLAAEIAAQIPR